jgi:hypothetical protein
LNTDHRCHFGGEPDTEWLKNNSVIELDLKMITPEGTKTLDKIFSGQKKSVGLTDAINAIEDAKKLMATSKELF